MDAAGDAHTVLLRSDGPAVACGSNFDGQCDLPALDGGRTYVSRVLPKLVLQALFVDAATPPTCRVRKMG